MILTESDVVSAAMELNVEARSRVAEVLLASVTGPEDQPLSPAWAEEIRKRLERLDSGETELIPASKIFSHLREKYRG